MKGVVKKALLIGINYRNTKHELNGCINDCNNLKHFLIKNKYCPKNNILTISDEDKIKPTKQNILNELDKLVKFCNHTSNKNKNIFLFVSYSGHGASITDTNNDEIDKKDEVLVPLDYAKSGIISDDILKTQFINKLPRNVFLVMLSDACHSGTILDLKYNFTVDKLDTYTIHRNLRSCPSNVVMISGCRDNQTSSDAYIDNKVIKKKQYQGAMTCAFISSFNDKINYRNLINNMRLWLNKNNFSQVPQLSSTKYLNLNRHFLLTFFDK